MTTHFKVRSFIKNNPEWAMVIAGAFFANGFDEEQVSYPDEPFNVAIGQIYINTNEEIVREDYPITTDMFDNEIFDKFADIYLNNELRVADAVVTIEEAIKFLCMEAIKKKPDKELLSMIYIDEVGEDEFGTKALEIRVKDNVNSVAVSFMVNRKLELEEIYNKLM